MRITIDELRAFSFSLKHSIHVKSMLRKRKIQTKTTCFLLENMGNKQAFSKNSFFFCQCLDQTRLKFPIENPQKQPTQRPEAPTDASCSIHGSKCAGSRYRIELRQLVYLNVGVSSRFFYKWSFVIGGPYKMAENSCGFFYPYKMELYTSYPFSKSITFYANLRFCHRFSEAELV